MLRVNVVSWKCIALAALVAHIDLLDEKSFQIRKETVAVMLDG